MFERKAERSTLRIRSRPIPTPHIQCLEERDKQIAKSREDRNKVLEASWRSETLHRPFPLSQWHMRVPSSIVEPHVRLVLDCRHHLPPGCSIGSQLVCNHALWRDALFLQEAYQQSLGSLGAAAVPDYLITDVSVLIDGSPKPIFLTSDADDDFIQMPDIVWAGTLPLEPTGIFRAEFQSPSTDGLIRNDETTIPRSSSISSTKRRLSGKRKQSHTA